nr:GNAT family N-acetyltransferase [Granulicella aggregans]
MYDYSVPETITTPRLELIAITPEALRSEQAADGTLASILNCRVPAEWPHADWEPHVFELLLSTFAEHPEDIDWHRYILLRSEDQEKPVLIGTTGAFRWPSNRSEAEFGYAILPEFRLHGYATEAAKAMLAWIEAQNAVSTVIAHTYPELLGSIRILERCNFTVSGPGAEPRTFRYVRQR